MSGSDLASGKVLTRLRVVEGGESFQLFDSHLPVSVHRPLKVCVLDGVGNSKEGLTLDLARSGMTGPLCKKQRHVGCCVRMGYCASK